MGNEVFELLLEDLIAHSYSRVFVLVDANTEKFCLPLLHKYLFDTHLIRIPAGEEHKSLETAQFIWNELQKNGADKQAVLVNLGGGVVSDIGGFCAATYKRGIDFINVPTTLLSMVDASVGGKLGVDFNQVKNVIGLIQNPKAVYIYPGFLSTLPEREIKSGFAEVIKHALIADEEYWEKISKFSFDEWHKLPSLINMSVRIKMQVVKKDPLEKSTRKALNFGHTVGHAMESYSLIKDKRPLNHGEAVAIGMICEAYLSKEAGLLSGKELKQISELILKHYPKYSLRTVLSPELLRLMKQDKKNMNEAINFTLLKRIGKASIDHYFTEHQVSMALNYYDAL